jgi:hypothetical protein
MKEDNIMIAVIENGIPLGFPKSILVDEAIT